MAINLQSSVELSIEDLENDNDGSSDDISDSGATEDEDDEIEDIQDEVFPDPIS